jgi:hypothetical protein
VQEVSFSEPFDARIGVLGWITAQQVGYQVFISAGPHTPSDKI